MSMTAARERAPVLSPWKTATTAGLEIGWHLLHLKQPFEQKNATGPQEAQTWFRFVHGCDEQSPVLGEKLASGLFFSVY